MTVRHIKIFLQVYNTQSMTQAAKILHMAQPAVTRAIRELETYYGVRLFDRINQRLSVTESGKQLYSQALHIADSFDAIEKKLRNWDSFGVLRVGASITLGNFLLPSLVSKFQEAHPSIKIQVIILNGSDLQNALLDNNLDLALMEGVISDPDLCSEAFGENHLVLILPPGHPLTGQEKIELKNLACCPLLLREKGSSVRTFLDNIFAAKGIELRPLWESASTHAIINAVSFGIGISILPEHLVHKDILEGTVNTNKIYGQSLARNHYLVWHKNKYLTAAAEQFIQLCKNTSIDSPIP